MDEKYPFPLEETTFPFAEEVYRITFYSVPQVDFLPCDICGEIRTIYFEFVVISEIYKGTSKDNLADPLSFLGRRIGSAFLKSRLRPRMCKDCGQSKGL